jgi:hypothetical protein
LKVIPFKETVTLLTDPIFLIAKTTPTLVLSIPSRIMVVPLLLSGLTTIRDPAGGLNVCVAPVIGALAKLVDPINPGITLAVPTGFQTQAAGKFTFDGGVENVGTLELFIK